VRILVFCFALLVAAASAIGEDLTDLDGNWEGSLVFLQGEGVSVRGPNQIYVRIMIAGSETHVFTRRKDGSLKEVKPGSFQTTAHRSNAVISAINSGDDKEGTWVETWSFAVTKSGPTTLLVVFTRLVNNLNLPMTSDHGKFAHVASGELRLVN
jgi:hypothetical protein